MTVAELICELEKCPQDYVVDLQTNADLGVFAILEKVIPSSDRTMKYVTLYGETDEDYEDYEE